MADCRVLGLQIDTLAGNYEKMTMIAPVQFRSPFRNTGSGTEHVFLGLETAKKENSYLFLVFVPIRNAGRNRTGLE